MRGLTDINDYRDVLSTDSYELEELYADLLIEVTEFFRDRDAFTVLKEKVLTELTDNLKDGSSLRVWVPGCASGEEAYSIAILLQEQARTMGIFLHLKIMATDIHVRSMNQASSGIYNEEALKNMPHDIIERYFDSADGQAQIKPGLRNMVFFSTHDVTRDPPFTRIDLISCRNLLIYLKEEAQERVMKLLHFSLRKNGFLFLGPSEHIGAIAHEFENVNEKWRIFKKRRDIKLLESQSIFHRTDMAANVARIGLNQRHTVKTQKNYADDTIPFKRAHKAALESIVERYAPPGFLLTEDGVVVHIFGNAGEFIPVQSGSFSKRIVDLIRPELKVIVSAAIDHARAPDFTGFRRAAYVKGDSVTAATYEVSLLPMELAGEALKFQLLSIDKTMSIDDSRANEVASGSDAMVEFDSSQVLQQRISVLEHNLQSSEESLQSTIEELETSNEELQSTNEELMSTNEELQSTNEELHSVNEELYTVSAEHQRKNEELIERETDIDVLLLSSKIGTIHLDENLRLRRYTNNARSVFNILPQDVGRPIEHITIRSATQDIPELILDTNQHRKTHETQVTVDEYIYLLRIMPYRSDKNVPSGVLITVIDITDVELVRGQLKKLNLQYKNLVENTDSFFVRWDATTNKLLFCNEVYARTFSKNIADLVDTSIGQFIDQIDTDNQISFRDSLSDINPNQARTDVLSRVDADGFAHYARVITRAVSADGKEITEYIANGYDITTEQHYRIAQDKLFSLLSNELLEIDYKIDQILKVGLEYFQLDSAIVSMISGEVYEVVYTRSRVETKKEPVTKMQLNDTFCSQFVGSNSSLLLDDISNSEMNELPCHEMTGIESFVGAVIQTINGVYGTVSFTSVDMRGKPYQPQDKNFAIYLGSWIGFLLGSQKQIKIMSNQNEYYQNLFRSVPAMLFLCDIHGLILSASDRLCTKLGINHNLLVGESCYNAFVVDDLKKLKETLSKGDSNHLPLSFFVENGSNLDVELNCSIKNVGSLKGVRMVVLSDVSERNKAKRNLEEQNRRLEMANENLNKFAFVASHDLQEPLRKIQQFSGFLEEDLPDSLNEETKYHLSVIVDASDRMSTLIQDLLKFSGATREQPELEKVDLDGLIAEVTDILAIPIEEANAIIEIKPLPIVVGDTSMLRQMFVNLISNSIKYRSDQRTLKVTVMALGEDLKDGIEIMDNGIGFENEFAKKILEPFNRLHRSSEYQGNGIGLAICSTVCDKHNWKLSATGQVGVGSSFLIDFQRDLAIHSSKQTTKFTNDGV